MNISEKNQTNRRQLWQIEKMKSIIEERWGEVQIEVEAREFKLKNLRSIRYLVTSPLEK